MDRSQTMRVFEYIKDEIDAGNEFPGQTKIARYMGWKFSGGVNDVLTRLVCSGLLIRTRAQPGSRKKWQYEIAR